MAEDKKGFLLYADYLSTIQKLPIDKIGTLFLTILQYVNDENPVVIDPMVDLVFEPIKNTLKRDLKKYEKFRQKQSENGKKGGRPTKPKNPSLKLETQKSLIDNVIVNVNDITLSFEFVETAWKIPFMQWVDYRQKTKKPFTMQVSLEQSYSGLKDLSNNNLLHAQKIVQYCIENQYVTLCKDDKKSNHTAPNLQSLI